MTYFKGHVYHGDTTTAVYWFNGCMLILMYNQQMAPLV